MAHNDRRSRSNTSISTKSNRPLSRASTASIASFDQHDPSNAFQPQFQQQSQQPNGFQPQFNQAFQPPLNSALVQAAQQASQQEGYSLDNIQQHLMAYNANDSQPSLPNGASAQSFSQHALQTNLSNQQQMIATPTEVEDKKKGSASGSATNDKELRDMLRKNDGRALGEVAAEVIATDRTSRAEKSKQLFAMLWLKSVCKRAKTSVPRNRVYSKYAERCGTERVIPLNPASFGKLVRVIFPNIQTRRLGVRGESKYHYVDLELLMDSETAEDARRPGTGHQQQSGLRRQSSIGPKLDFNTMPRLPADTAAFPPQDQAFESQNTLFSQGTSKGRLFADIYSDQYRSSFGRQTSDTYEYELKFATQEQMAPEDNVPIVLPDIGPYLPHRTDPDSADALVSLYRSHCTSLIDSVRYCKEKQFFRLFASFHGTLTVPVQKLFAQQELVGWIRECDWMMYQKMIRNVSQLTLQVAPPQVMKFLDNIEKQLRPHLHKVFGSLPTHILEARLEPATLFTHLLRQMLRVNQSAHAAARMLMQDPLRDLMWSDWNTLVNPKRVIENELPQSCGHEEVYNILKNEVRTLLLPLNEGTWLPDGSYHSEPTNDSPAYNNETVIDRIAAFVTDLSSRFPHAPARTILHCLNAISTAICREVTVGQGGSFNSWWLTKVFIDELGHWLSSLGGFLAHTPQDPNVLSYSPGLIDESVHTMANGGSGSNNESRYSSIDDEFNPTQSFTSANGPLPVAGTSNTEIQPRRYPEQPDQVSFGIDFDMNTSQQEPNMDDSGIGMLDDPIESKFASIQRSLQAHISQLPTNPIR